MNPHRGLPASALLERWVAADLARLLVDAADEPDADALGRALAGRHFATTTDLARAVRDAQPHAALEAAELSVRRVFQALRIAVNEEFTALDTLLRQLPACLAPGGRVAILTFHSGEDRRVKKAFAEGLAAGLYDAVANEVLRPGAAERHRNPRSTSAKLRWARRARL